MSTDEAEKYVSEQTAIYLRVLTLSPDFEVQVVAMQRLAEERKRLELIRQKQQQPELELTAPSRAA